MAEVRKVEFNSLPSTIRQRFIACVHGKSSPLPIFSEKTYASAIVGLVLLALLGLGTLCLTWMIGFGTASDVDSIQKSPMIGFYVISLFLLVGPILSIIRRVKLKKALPYPSGRYIFPTDFVDARTSTLRIIPLALLEDFKAVHHHTNGVYTHTAIAFKFGKAGTENFSISGKTTAETALQELQIAQRRLSDSVRAQNYQEVSYLDPFFELRMNDGWKNLSSTPQRWDALSALPIPPFLHKRWLIALGCALILSSPLWFIRNWLSDEAMFSQVKSADSVFLYQQYLARDGGHAEEVKTKLPPAALREAKRAKTVTALRAVIKDYPNHAVATEAKTIVHELYAQTLSEFREQASTKDPKMLPFMERLLNFLEQHDTNQVNVNFRRPTATSLADADRELQAELSKKGQQFAPISPHFKDENSSSREAVIVEKLNKAFISIFPRDIFHLEKGKTIGEQSPSSSDLSAPAIEIFYNVSPSGEVYVSQTDKRSFVGILISFDMWMRIPQDVDSFNFKLKVEPPEHFTVEYTRDSQYSRGSPSDNQVYDVMATHAFNEFSTKLHEIFFKSSETDSKKNTKKNGK